MRERLRSRAAASATAFQRVFGNADLRRVQLAGAGSVLGSWAYTVALAVYAYEAGGAAAVGLVGLIRFVPSALASPFAAVLGDRYPRARVMVASDLVRFAAMGVAAAAIALDATPAIVYALAAVSTVAGTAFRPAQSALLPSLARTPEELTAANVAASTIESVGVFVGPALGGILLAAASPEVVFAANGLTFLWSALLIARIGGEDSRLPRGTRAEARGGALRQSAAGFVAVAREPGLRIVVLLTAAQTLVFGAVTVLVVVLAFDVLETDAAGVGLLNSAIGVGGLLGALAAAALVGRARLAESFGVGIALWGLPLALVAVWVHPLAALVLFAAIGGANTVVDVTGLTLMQRIADERVLARVFGVLEGLIVATIAVGALAAPLLVSLLGARGALVATGAFLPVLTALTWPALARVDTSLRTPRAYLSLLRGDPIFAPLPAGTLERIAGRLVETPVAAGETVLESGRPGDCFYLVAEGEIDVEPESGEPSTLGPGSSFGEIALLRDVPRTATVRARTDARLLALDREDFLAAVTGHAPSAEAANAVIASRLGPARVSTA